MASVSDPAARDAGDLERLLEEQAALRRVATLVASGAAETEIVSAVASEIGRLLDADTANALRWDGETLQVIGEWFVDGRELPTGRLYVFGGDTISARVIEAAAPARIDSADDLKSDFARKRWVELGIGASLGAPILVEGAVWGVVTVSRFPGREPFEAGAEDHLGDFAGLVAQAIANAAARAEMAALVEEQSALRRIATLVAGGRPPREVLSEVTAQVGRLFDAHAVHIVEWQGVLDEVAVVCAWTADPLPPPQEGDLLHPPPEGAIISVLETGSAYRSAEGDVAAIAAPLIINATLRGTLSVHRGPDRPFPPGAEARLRSFADLAAQSISNHRAQEELRASRARIVAAGDTARQRLERNLHDGAQQRLVSVSISLRVALARLAEDPDGARGLLAAAAEELTHALQDLRDLARGLHPAILSEHGLKPALEALVRRAQLPVTVANHVDGRLPAPVEAAAYYVVAEALTNVQRYAGATGVTVTVRCGDGQARVEVTDDGRGGATMSQGSGLRGLADRVEALGGRIELDSRRGSGTTVRALIPLEG
jgi:signal transduction histidine kinase